MQIKTIQYKQHSIEQHKKQLYAYYDDSQVLAYIPHIGAYFSEKTVSRPIWITTSFTWMMHHADWLSSSLYTSIECMAIERTVFDEMLFQAFPAFYPNHRFDSEKQWNQERSSAVIQFRWDTNYLPDGQELEEEVLLLSIHSRTWMQYVIDNKIQRVTNIDEALFSQKENAKPPYDLLIVPDERVYPIDDISKNVIDI